MIIIVITLHTTLNIGGETKKYCQAQDLIRISLKEHQKIRTLRIDCKKCYTFLEDFYRFKSQNILLQELFKVKETIFEHRFQNCTTIYIMRIIGSSYPHNKLSLFLYFKVLKFLQSAYFILLSTGPKTLLVSVCYLYDPPYFKIA